MTRRLWKWGDLVAEACKAIGITPERIERWVGEPCNCKERQAKMNAAGAWAERIVLGGKTEDAAKHLDSIIGEDEKGKTP